MPSEITLRKQVREILLKEVSEREEKRLTTVLTVLKELTHVLDDHGFDRTSKWIKSGIMDAIRDKLLAEGIFDQIKKTMNRWTVVKSAIRSLSMLPSTLERVGRYIEHLDTPTERPGRVQETDKGFAQVTNLIKKMMKTSKLDSSVISNIAWDIYSDIVLSQTDEDARTNLTAMSEKIKPIMERLVDAAKKQPDTTQETSTQQTPPSVESPPPSSSPSDPVSVSDAVSTIASAAKTQSDVSAVIKQLRKVALTLPD